MENGSELVVAGKKVSVVEVVQPDETSSGANSNPLKVLHSLLLGRYKWAVLLGAIGMAVGGFIAYEAMGITYESRGMIQIRPNVPRILYQSEQNGVIPMFQSFVDAQAALIKSDRVVNMAMQDPDWQAVGRGASAADVALFAAKMDVDHPKGSQMIQVSFVDASPEIPAIAVRVTIKAYERLYGETDAKADARTLQVLEERKTLLSNEMKSLNQRIMDIASEFGSHSLDQMVQDKVKELNELRTELRRVEYTVMAAESAVSATPAATTSRASADLVAASDFAASDSLMRSYLQQRMEAERALDQLRGRLGENHPIVTDAKIRLKSLDDSIINYTQSLAQSRDMQAAAAISKEGVYLPGSLERLRAREKNLRDYYEQARKEVADLGRKNITIQNLRYDAEDLQRRLDETKRRIEQLNIESMASGRVEVIHYGTAPMARDANKKMTAMGGGGVAGGIVGVGLIALFGLMDQRLRNISDTRTPNMKHRRLSLLGAVPMLDGTGASNGQAVDAAHAIHRIRARLQIHASASNCRAIAITSPSAGNGKTSITTALGMSFAASGSRTLLIDADVLGGGLTSRMNGAIRRKLGDMLVRKGLVTREQVDFAVRRARESGLKCGEALVELGFVREDEVNAALASQHHSMLGLLDAVAGDPLEECVAATGTPRLFVLPVGSARSQDVAQLSPQAIRRLLADAKKHFDTVLIDTGPILGSLEAAMVAAEADGVVVTVARGGLRPTLEAAIDDLESIGAKVLGCIFNRALDNDIAAAGFSSFSTRSISRNLLPAEKGSRLGPLASALSPSDQI